MTQQTQTPAQNNIAYTDGACKGNPGAGGWGVYLQLATGEQQQYCGGEQHTTNNRMELMAAIKAIEFTPATQPLQLWTDSSYVKDGITNWIYNWKKNNWRTRAKKPVKNADLWQQLDTIRQNRNIDWQWIKGHAGHVGNEKADELANQGATEIMDNAKNPQQNKTDDWLVNDILGFDALEAEITDTETVTPTVADNMLVNNLPSDSLPTHQAQTLDEINEQLLQASEQITDDNGLTYNPNYVDTSDTITPPNQVALNPANDEVTQPHNTNGSDHINQPQQVIINDFDGDTSKYNPGFVALLPNPINQHANDRQLILDTETTGMDPAKGDRIIEVGIVELVNRRFTGEKLHVYINPERDMDEEVIAVHGITSEFLTDKPKFAEVSNALLAFMQGAELIAHNASFDMNFLSYEFHQVGIKDFANQVKVTDSLALAKQNYPGQKNSLDALVKRLNVGKQDRTFHGALLDAEILAEVYLAMTGGQVALAIHDDTSTQDGTHQTFNTPVTKVMASHHDETAHQNWLAQLAEKHPALLQKWQNLTPH